MAIVCGRKESGWYARRPALKIWHRVYALLIVVGFLSSTHQRAFGISQPDDQRLVADVETLNEIVIRYKRAGGWFSERDNAQRVMVRLAMAQGDFGVTMLGKNSGHRMLPVTALKPPQSAKWAYWNVASERFQVWRGAAPHNVQVVTRFARRQDAAPLGSPAMRGNRGATAPPQRQGTHDKVQSVAAKLQSSAAGNVPLPGPSLLAPRFDPPAGRFSAAAFESLSIHLRDANPEGERKMHYSIDGSPWKEYSGNGIRVEPGSEILAYCGRAAGDQLADSGPVAARYVLEPLQINLELKAPVTQLPAEALHVGKGRGLMFPVLTITNIASLPASVRSRELFEVVWTIDGSDPLRSETAFPVTFSKGYGKGARLPLTVLSGQSSEKLRIRAAARSTDRHLLLDSREAVIELEIVR